MGTVNDDDGFILASPLLAQRVAVLPTAAVLAVAPEARAVLALGPRDARATVGIGLPVLEREALEIDVRRRLRIALRLRWGGRSIWRGGWGAPRAGCRAARGEHHHQTKVGEPRSLAPI